MDKKFLDAALCHLDNWLNAPERHTELKDEQIELMGAVSLVVRHVEQQRMAREDLDGVVADDDIPDVPVAACCAAFILESISETLEIFTDDSDHSAVLKLRESRDLLDNYMLKTLTA